MPGRNVAIVMVLTALIVGCDKDKEKGDAANAQLALANGTSLLLADDPNCPDLGGGYRGEGCFTPESYGLKILNVYVSPDPEGAQSAPAGLIWANPDCPLKTSTTTMDDKEFTYESIGDGCSDQSVTTFFELARPTDEVNAELNSQPHNILPGTYNYVQMEFCMGGPSSKNAQFQADGMDEVYQVTASTCGITSAKADPAIVVAEGEAVTVSLTYDLTNSIFTASAYAGQDHCYTSADQSVVRCLGALTLTPSFAKE